MKDIDTIDTTANDLTTSDRQIKLHHILTIAVQVAIQHRIDTVVSFTTTLAKSTQRPIHIFGSLD